MKRTRIGEIFVDAGLISSEDLRRVLSENQKIPEEKLGKTLVRLQLASETEVARALSFQLGVPYIDLETVVVDPVALQRVPMKLALEKHLLPLYLEKNDLIVVMDDPQDLDAIEAVRFTSGLNIRPHIAEAGQIEAAIRRYYSVEESLEDLIRHLPPVDQVEVLMERNMSQEQLEDLKAQGESPAVMKLLNTLIFQGLSVQASSIFIEAQEQETIIKNVFDGMLVESMRTPKWTLGALLSRIKMLSGLDLAQRYVPQKGTLTFKTPQRIIELEVSCLPTHYGESALLHFLTVDNDIIHLEELGLLPDSLADIQTLLQRPEGLILACGPLGSGKTHLLYAMAEALLKKRRKVVSVESPIEYRLQGLQQVQVNEQSGLTFSRSLASLLRHHPDAVMIGEFRDRETAEIAMNAAGNKHLILSAVMAEDLISSLRYLARLGLNLTELASSLSALISQRTVRKICARCRETYTPSSVLSDKIRTSLGKDVSCPLWRGKGCPDCHYTGYHGQLGVYQVFSITRSVQTFMAQGAPDGRLKDSLSANEANLLKKSLLSLIEQGLTTPDELERVLPSGQHRGSEVRCEHCRHMLDIHKRVCPYCGHAPDPQPAHAIERVRHLEQIAAPQDSRGDSYAYRGRKILLIDDDRDMVERLRLILEEKQFLVSVAQNGQEALTMIEREKPHLIVTDVMMPVMDGLELIRRLRKGITTTFIPVIILSSKNEIADRLKGFAVGTDDYLPKPFSIHELFFRVNAILRRVYQ